MHLVVNGIQHRVTGEILVPNSKYHAHRALILASLADGVSRVHGLSDARHVEYTVRLLRDLGVQIARDGDAFVVHGLGGLYRPRREAISMRQLRHDAVLHDRSGLTVGPRRVGDRAEVLQATPGRPPAARPRTDGCPAGVGRRLPAHPCTGPQTHGRPRHYRGHPVPVGLGPDPVGPVRDAAHHHRGGGRTQRTPLPGTDRGDDAAVRPRSDRLRGLAALRHRARPAGAQRRADAAAGHRLGRVRHRDRSTAPQ